MLSYLGTLGLVVELAASASACGRGGGVGEGSCIGHLKSVADPPHPLTHACMHASYTCFASIRAPGSTPRSRAGSGSQVRQLRHYFGPFSCVSLHAHRVACNLPSVPSTHAYWMPVPVLVIRCHARFTAPGSGNSFETCSSRCLRTADCRFMSRSARGWCRFFSGCDDVVHYDNAAAWITCT